MAFEGRSALHISKPTILHSLSCSSCDFVSHVSTSQPGFFLGASDGVDVAFQAEASVEAPRQGQECCGLLALPCLGCSARCFVPILHFILLPVTLAPVCCLITAHSIYSFCLRVVSNLTDKWVGESPVRTEPLRGGWRVVWLPVASWFS